MPEQTPREDHGPFSKQLKEDLFGSTSRERDKRLQGMEEHDDIVIRVDQPVGTTVSVKDTELKSARDKYQNDQKNEEAKDTYLKALDKYYEIDETRTYRQYLKELDSEYGIKNSGYAPIIGKEVVNNGAQRYIVTNKIEGISGESHLSSVPEHALIAILRKILAHYKDVYKNGGAVSSALDLEQFVYDPNLDEMILVDLESRDLDTGILPLDPNIARAFNSELQANLRYIERKYKGHYPELKAEIEQAFS